MACEMREGIQALINAAGLVVEQWSGVGQMLWKSGLDRNRLL